MRTTNFQWLSIVTWLVQYAFASPGYAEISMWHGSNCYDDLQGIGLLAVDTALTGCYLMPFDVYSFSITEKATAWRDAYVDFCEDSKCNPAKCQSIKPAKMAPDYCFQMTDGQGRQYYTVRKGFTKREIGAGPDPIDSEQALNETTIDSEQALNETTGLESEPSKLERRSSDMKRGRRLSGARHALLTPAEYFKIIPLVVGGDRYRIISTVWTYANPNRFSLERVVLELARDKLRLGDYIQDMNRHYKTYGAGLTVNVAYQCTKAVFGAINPFHESLVPAIFDEVVSALSRNNNGPRVGRMIIKVLHTLTGAEQEWTLSTDG